MNQQKAQELSERIFNELNSALSCLNLYIGHKLNLFQALHDGGPSTSKELAAQTKYNERYIREWLECMAVSGYIDYDSDTGRFALSPEHATVFLDRDSVVYSASASCFIPSIAGVLNQLIAAFKNGGGVPYEAYGEDILEGIAMLNRPLFISQFASKWIPEMPDVEGRLKAGGRVADIGCGAGWSSISLAKGFPKTLVDAVDIDEESIRIAQENARKEGVSNRVKFHLTAAEDASLDGPYDLVTAFLCLHDMPYPVKALRRMRDLAGADGTVLIADEAVGDSIDENRNFLGVLSYNFSVLHCLPQAMVFPDAAGTGTVIRPSTIRRYAEEAGFSNAELLSIEHPMWHFYRLTP